MSLADIAPIRNYSKQRSHRNPRMNDTNTSIINRQSVTFPCCDICSLSNRKGIYTGKCILNLVIYAILLC